MDEAQPHGLTCAPVVSWKSHLFISDYQVTGLILLLQRNAHGGLVLETERERMFEDF